MNKTKYILNFRSTLLRKMLRPLVIALAMIPASVWSQTDYSGAYYIAMPGTGTYNSSDQSNNYYLVPTEGWAFYVATNNVQAIDNGQPFLTTYKCRNGVDDLKSYWIIIKDPTLDYYYIRHAVDGRYLTYNGTLPGVGDQNRARVHLEATITGDNNLFAITKSSNNYFIAPKADNGQYLNINQGNFDSYAGYYDASNNKTNQGPTGFKPVGGILGRYNSKNETSQFRFEAATQQLSDPTTTATSLGHYTINPPTELGTLPDGYTIRYTLDGSEVSATSSIYNPNEAIEVTEDGTLRASVWVNNIEISSGLVADVTAGIAKPTFNVLCDNSLELSCVLSGASIKYVINDPDPAHCTTDYTKPITVLSDGNTVYARSYKGTDYSDIKQFTYYTNTPAPTVTLNENNATISFTGTADIYYTTNGQDPVVDENGAAGTGTTLLDNQTNTATIAISPSVNVELHIVAKQADRGFSCPVTVVKRPKQPTINAQSLCYNSYRAHELTFTNTESDKTYWYALSNGSEQTPPATNTFTEYTPGETVEITSIPEYNLSSATVTLHAYTKDSEGNISLIVSQDYILDFTPDPIFSFSDNDNTVTITADGATIDYTVNGGSQQTATSTASVTVNLGERVTIVASATKANLQPSCEVTYTKSRAYIISSLADLNAMTTNGIYELSTDISDASSYTSKGTADAPFTGILDGKGHTINGLTTPLFGVVNNAVICNVNLKGVAIPSTAGDTVGAIACVAKGYTRIYNCGILPTDNTFPSGTHPSVAAVKCAGGLVGSLWQDSRVVNCFSYADVTATNSAAGIVGRNTYASTAEVSNGKYTKLRTMVVNCMFYGDILGGTNQYGVYGGQLITNAAATGISSYNYYRNGTTFSTSSGNPTAYNCSFPAEERYLTQVEFHRSLLNSNRELCGWWVGSNVAPSTLTTAEVQSIPKDASLIYKWVVDPNIAPYPILKPFGKYPSIVNPNTGTPWFDRSTANRYEGRQLGTLTVTVKSGDHSSATDKTLTIPITDMDTLHHDYCYRKIQLPYFNTVFGNPNSADWTAKYAGNYTDYVVTGWKVTAITGGTQGTFQPNWQTGYNFADRKCTDKDLYSVSGRVFAQGGNYYVPDGVTAITIEAYWGKAIYIRNADASYDRVNIAKTSESFTNGSHFAPAGTRDNNVNGATIQIASTKGSIRDALTDANIDAKKTVYDYALVLVGNVQEAIAKNDILHATDATRGYTVMSVDLDFDEEPDYCLEWQLGNNMGRQAISPIRFDFIPVVELGIAGKLHNSTYFLSLGCHRSKGHFEVTETSFIRFGQFEFELPERDEGPVILNGGIYDQYCRGRNNETNQHINYVILGGHVVMPSFTPGAHVNSNATYQTRHCAVNALGGDFKSFYLTGGFNESIVPYEDNPHCYIDGGHFGTVAAAYKEGIAGDVTWRINHALIGEFYGGGVMSQKTGTNYKIVKGSIDVVIDSSIVGKYCGGPKFGDMVSGKTVTTSATGTTFGYYYGAGNGGTNYVQYKNTDATGSPISDWSSTINPNYTPKQYRNTDQGYHADYDYEVINYSSGDGAGKVVNRSYYYSAQFATTNTGNVTSTLTGCTVLNNFYGAGFLGGVTGTVTSTLTDTRVMGSAFGAGYSASSGTVTIHNKDKKPPVVNTYTGMITYNPEGTSTTYNWTHETSIGGNTLSKNSPEATYEGKNYFYTEISLDNLGAVSSNVLLTINGNSEIGTIAETNMDLDDGTHVAAGSLIPGTGNVFGGGDQSAVNGNTDVKIQGNVTILGNVYGGGNKGFIGGNASVEIKDPTP